MIPATITLPVPVAPSARVLLLTADTGGGHRSSAEALLEEFAHRHGERVTSIAIDPMTGPTAPRLVSALARLYGPLVRHTPWLWALLFHGTNLGPVREMMTALVTRLLRRPLTDAFERHKPDVVAVLHPLLVAPATAVCRSHRAQVISVVTDLGRPHGSWWHPDADQVIVPRRGLTRGRTDLHTTTREHVLGTPVRRQFVEPPPDRDRARRRLGLDPRRFLVMVTGGGEGVHGTERWARALAAGPVDVDVLVVCGRSERLRQRLLLLTPKPGRRFLVTGFVDDMAAHMCAADLLVTKAGPGIIAEATALGVPLLVAGHLPGQEDGNREHVVRASAGLAVDSTQDLLAAIHRLRTDPALLRHLQAGSRQAGDPRAGALTTELIMTLSQENR